MKSTTLSATLLFVSVLSLTSCKKMISEETAAGTMSDAALSASNNSVATLSSPDNSSKVFVTWNGSEYISSYGGGITFGGTLPHPIDDPTGIYDGYPIPTIAYVNWTLNQAPIPYTIDGAVFSLLEPTFPTSGITNAEATLASLHQYNTLINTISGLTFLNDSQKVAAMNQVPSPQITATASGGGGVIRVSGKLIQDHLSPTYMSVVDEKYVQPIPVGAKKTVGVKMINGYIFYMYAPTSSTDGAVTSVSAKQGGNLNSGTLTPGVELTQFPSTRTMGINLTVKF